MINLTDKKWSAENRESIFENSSFILDHIPFLVAYINRELRYQFVNAEYAKWVGLLKNEIVHRTMPDVLGADYYETIRPRVESALNGEFREFLVRAKNAQGQFRPLMAKYLPHFKADTREVLGFVLIVEDISEKESIHEKLVESENRLQYALAATGEGVWDWKIPDNTVHHNRQWCQLLGLDDQFLVHPLEEFAKRIHPADKEGVLEKLNLCLAGKGAYSSEHRMLKENGEYFWVSDRGNVVERGSEGEAQRMVGSFRDITQIRETQAHLIQNSKLASLGVLAGGIAHEINNPLAIINLKSDGLLRKLARGDVGRDQLVSDLSKISETVGRIAKIIQSLRIFSGRSEKESRELVKVRQIIDDALNLCRERMKVEGVRIEIDETFADTFFPCFPGQVGRILMSLLTNSFDALNEVQDKWIRIEAECKEKWIFLRVIDSGSKISDHVIEHMMTPFFTTKGIGKGAGLGLSISKGLAEQNGGKLYLDQKAPHTTFVLELPM